MDRREFGRDGDLLRFASALTLEHHGACGRSPQVIVSQSVRLTGCRGGTFARGPLLTSAVTYMERGGAEINVGGNDATRCEGKPPINSGKIRFTKSCLLQCRHTITSSAFFGPSNPCEGAASLRKVQEENAGKRKLSKLSCFPIATVVQRRWGVNHDDYNAVARGRAMAKGHLIPISRSQCEACAEHTDDRTRMPDQLYRHIGTATYYYQDGGMGACGKYLTNNDLICGIIEDGLVILTLFVVAKSKLPTRTTVIRSPSRSLMNVPPHLYNVKRLDTFFRSVMWHRYHIPGGQPPIAVVIIDVRAIHV
ncbi:hypothetical protein L210DRAFT_3632112, partial [Boletus edulis BED1]